MDSIDTAMHLITKDCWKESIDLKDAYYSVKVDESFQKYLKFWYDGKLWYESIEHRLMGYHHAHKIH